MLPWIFSRKGASGFSWASTADQVTAGISAAGLTAIVTGASSGIGAETARVLAARGAHVVMAVRNLAAGDTVRQAVLAETPGASVEVMELDLSSLASVRNFAAGFAATGLPLNILINNAGIMATPFSLSTDGIEMQFATNHVGHFLLTHLLLETMKKTSRESNVEGRIVTVASEGHRVAYKEGIRFAKINDEEGYGTLAAYGRSLPTFYTPMNLPGDLRKRVLTSLPTLCILDLSSQTFFATAASYMPLPLYLQPSSGRLVNCCSRTSSRGLRRSATWRCTRMPKGCRASTGATAICTIRLRMPRTRS
ncbi:hypothetical protein ACQJBY_037849 [Aegilops geniculata]